MKDKAPIRNALSTPDIIPHFAKIKSRWLSIVLSKLRLKSICNPTATHGHYYLVSTYLSLFTNSSPNTLKLRYLSQKLYKKSDLILNCVKSTYLGNVQNEIGPFQSTKSERAKLKVKARLNLHGIVFWKKNLRFLSQKSKQSTNEAPIHVAPPSTNETDVNMQDAMDTANAPGAKNGVPESGDKHVQMETDAKADAKKINVKKTNIPVTELVDGGMPPSEVQKAIEKEFEMALQDRVMEETKDKKNVVEAYVYDMRNKEVEDWMYENGEDETKGVYIAKLEELKKQGDPIEEGVKKHTERGTVIDQLAYCVNSYRKAAALNDAKFEHIDITDKQKFCRSIMTKRKPALAKPAALETPPTPPPQESEQPQGGDASPTKNPADNNNEAPQAST
ncbi:heat shock 70 kDa protein 15 [Malus domestica]|uniref:heat shock 70 kDa protein 15 n=1 Tax=Malus domestica TaxID=3750 RepID=UPI0039768378